MKMLFCTPYYFGYSGDAVNERQLAESLSKRVEALYVLNLFDVVLLHPAYRKTLFPKTSKHNIKVINIPLVPPVPVRFVLLFTIRLLFYNLILLLLTTLLKKLRVVDTVYVRGPQYAFAFATFKKAIGPFAVKFPGFYTEEALDSTRSRFQKSLIINVFERINYRVVNSTDLLLTHSSFYESELRRRYCLPKTKPIVVVSAGIERNRIIKIRERCQSLRRDTDVNKSEVRIGVVGSTNWWDGLDILLESIPYIQESYPNVVLNFIVGGGDLRVLKDLRLRAKALGINVVIAGPLPHEEALKKMCELRALVLPRRRTFSTEFTIPIKVVEALALGVPVIITRHKVFESKFKDCEDVIYVEPEPKDVAKKVIMLLSNLSLAERLSSKSLQLAMEFSYDRIAENLIDALSAIDNKGHLN